MTTHVDHHYSITVHTDDVAILYCLRALADLAQASGNTRIAWANTKRSDWEAANHQATFHFSHPSKRVDFAAATGRLLPARQWAVVAQSDSDPAVPAR